MDKIFPTFFSTSQISLKKILTIVFSGIYFHQNNKHKAESQPKQNQYSEKRNTLKNNDYLCAYKQ